MRKLENYGVLALRTKETREIDGGIFGIDDLALIGIGALVGAIFTQDFGDLGDAFNDGYNAY